jgi:hypothetical protein
MVIGDFPVVPAPPHASPMPCIIPLVSTACKLFQQLFRLLSNEFQEHVVPGFSYRLALRNQNKNTTDSTPHGNPNATPISGVLYGPSSSNATHASPTAAPYPNQSHSAARNAFGLAFVSRIVRKESRKIICFP